MAFGLAMTYQRYTTGHFRNLCIISRNSQSLSVPVYTSTFMDKDLLLKLCVCAPHREVFLVRAIKPFFYLTIFLLAYGGFPPSLHALFIA